MVRMNTFSFITLFIFSCTTEREVLCKDPGQINHGRQGIQSQTVHRVGSVILYRCLPGYEIEGNSSLNCTGSGHWSNDLPTCKRKHICYILYINIIIIV